MDRVRVYAAQLYYLASDDALCWSGHFIYNGQGFIGGNSRLRDGEIGISMDV